MDPHIEHHLGETKAEPTYVPSPPRSHIDVPVDADLSVDEAGTVVYGAPALHVDHRLDRIPPRRLAEIRARLESGAYNSPEVLRQVAVRLLESGDVG